MLSRLRESRWFRAAVIVWGLVVVSFAIAIQLWDVVIIGTGIVIILLPQLLDPDGTGTYSRFASLRFLSTAQKAFLGLILVIAASAWGMWQNFSVGAPIAPVFIVGSVIWLVYVVRRDGWSKKEEAAPPAHGDAVDRA